MLAKGRTPRETARAKYEIDSISTSRITSPRGVPNGMNYAKKCTRWMLSPRIITPGKIITKSPTATIIDVVTLNRKEFYPEG
jgi:hypothetical protein